MIENIPEWITNLALDIYRVIQQYKAMPRFHEMVNKWAENREAEIDRLITWNEQRRLHFEQTVARDPRLQDDKAGPPEQGWQFENHLQHTEKKTESGWQRSHNIINGWVPLELSNSIKPEITQLFPLSREHKLTLIEKYTVLAAVYDYGRKGTQEIPPWQWPGPDNWESPDALSNAKRSLFFESLCDAVSRIQPGEEGWLKAMLDDVKNDLRKNRPSAKNPILSKTFLNNLLRASIKHLPYVGSFLYDVIYGTDDQPQTKLQLDSTTGDNVETEPDTKSERERTIEGRKPWYKKTWIIIVGFVTVLTGLAALVCICESETGKHFINSFKRKPSISVDYRRTKL